MTQEVIKEVPKKVLLETNHTEINEAHISHILNDMAEVVKKSYGPIGASTLMIQKSGEGNVLASITKDGYTLLSKTKYFHPVAQALKQLVLSSMLGVLSTAGDGTTTTTILIAKLYESLTKLRKESKLPAQLFNNLVKEVVEAFKEEIDDEKEFAVADINDLYGIIETSVNDDTELKEAFINALNDITDNGKDLSNISVTYRADGTLSKTIYNIKEGYTIPMGPVGFPKALIRRKILPVIVDNHIANGEAIRNLMILFRKIASYMTSLLKAGTDVNSIAPVVLITYNLQYKDVLERELLQIKTYFKTQYNVDFLPIFILEYNFDGSLRSSEEHKDFEYLIGQPQGYELDKKIKDIFPDNIQGFTEEELDKGVDEYIMYLIKTNNIVPIDAIISKSQVTLYNFNKERIDELTKNLEDEMELNRSEKERVEAIKSRLRRINGKYAEIIVGGDNNWEVDRKMGAVDDAIGAIKSAVASGVCGGMSTIIPKVLGSVVLNYAFDKNHIGATKLGIAKAIFEAYEYLIDVLFESVGLSGRDEVRKATDGLSEDMDDYFSNCDDTPERLIRQSFDIRAILDKLYKGEEFTLNDVVTHKILNSIDAEKKILDASVGAVIALLGTNQITMPDQYDIESFKNGQL